MDRCKAQDSELKQCNSVAISCSVRRVHHLGSHVPFGPHLPIRVTGGNYYCDSNNAQVTIVAISKALNWAQWRPKGSADLITNSNQADVRLDQACK